MTEAVGPALEQALAYHRAPGMLPAAHGRPLPEGMLTLLRLAAGDRSLAAQSAQSCGEAESEVAAAAVFFIQQVMFASGSDSYRVLGVNPDAPDARIKEHYRWLVRWLHPDRNTDDWDSVYADRVNVAWQTLRLPERRREYDQSRLEAEFAAADYRRPLAAPVRHALPEPSLLSSSTVQRLPVLVLGGLGGFAVMVLVLMWLGADQGQRSAGPRVAAIPQEGPAALEQLPTVGPVAPVADPPAAPPEPAAVAVEPAAAPAMTAAFDTRITTSAPAVDEGEPELPAFAPGDELPAGPATPSVAQSPPPPAPVAPARPRPEPEPLSVAPPAPRRPAVTVSVPAPVPATTPTPPATPVAAAQEARLQEAQAHALLREFGQAYQTGDINALMRLFTVDARNDRGGREAIVYDYQSLFSGTESRRLELTPTGWILREEGATLLATYRARVRSSGRLRADVSEGSIRFDLRLVDGRARISQVRLGDGA